MGVGFDRVRHTGGGVIDRPERTADDPVVDPLEVERGEWHRRATLRDGTRVLIRQIRPNDRDRLSEGLRRLSPDSRYLRFHAEIDELTEEQLDYLTQVDHHDHEALVALDEDRPEIPGIGVARYIREPHEREVAEAAITVADEYQGLGAGTLLLGALAARARTCGVEVFRNYVLANNTAMLDVFDNLGATREPEAPGLWRVDLTVPESDADLPDTLAGRAFMTVARDGFRLSSLLPPVWGWRRGADTDEDDQPATGEPGIVREVASLETDLDQWLAERERRRVRFPAAPTPDDDAARDDDTAWSDADEASSDADAARGDADEASEDPRAGNADEASEDPRADG